MAGKPNKKVIAYSIIGLICLALMYLVSWWFIIPALLMLVLNQKELMKKKV